MFFQILKTGNNSDLIDINHSIHHSKMSFNNSSRNQTNDELYITAPMLSDKKNESVETINLSSDIDFESSAISVDNVKEQFLKNIIDNRNKLKVTLTHKFIEFILIRIIYFTVRTYRKLKQIVRTRRH